MIQQTIVCVSDECMTRVCVSRVYVCQTIVCVLYLCQTIDDCMCCKILRVSDDSILIVCVSDG